MFSSKFGFLIDKDPRKGKPIAFDSMPQLEIALICFSAKRLFSSLNIIQNCV